MLLGALLLGAIARGIGVQSDEQRTADLAALAGARAMHDAYAGLFEPSLLAGRANRAHLNATRFRFVQRYSWEPWHKGLR